MEALVVAKTLMVANAIACLGVSYEMTQVADLRVQASARLTSLAGFGLSAYWWLRAFDVEGTVLGNFGRVSLFVFFISVWNIFYTRRRANEARILQIQKRSHEAV